MTRPEMRDVQLSGEFHRREITKCVCCGKGLSHGGLPLFWRVTLERFGLDAGAVRRTGAMEQYFDSPAIAEVFSTGEPLGRRVDLSGPMLLCEPCVMDGARIVALWEACDREAPKAGPPAQVAP
jgi:hypothetical protein